MNSIIKETQTNKHLHIAEWLFIALFAYYYILPSANYSIPFLLMVGAGLLYLAYIMFFCSSPDNIIMTVVKVMAVILFISMCYYLFTVTMTVSSSVDNYELKRFISKFQQLFFTMFPLALIYRLLKFGSKNQKMTMFVFCAVLIVYVIIQSVLELSVNETASRVWGEFNSMSEKNVGTYNFVYAVAASLPATFTLAFNAKKIVYRVLFFIYLVLGLVFLVMAQYTISLLITVLLCFFGVFLATKRGTIRFLIALICPIFIIFLPNIIQWFADSFVGGSMRTRLYEVASYFTGEKMGYNLGGRFKLYKGTIDAFMASPLIGASGLKFDGHATFLTVLADIGIVGGIPFYWLYFAAGGYVKKLLNDKLMSSFFLLTFLSVILTGLLNPIHAAIPLPMVSWFVVPLMIDLFINREE